MEIVIKVNNEQEEELVKKLVKAMRELDFLEDLETADGKYASAGEQYLDAVEYRLLRENDPVISVEIDPSVREMEFDSSEFVSVTCAKCGKDTEGLIDNRPISLAEYVEITSEESAQSWKCETCWSS